MTWLSISRCNEWKVEEFFGFFRCFKKGLGVKIYEESCLEWVSVLR